MKANETGVIPLFKHATHSITEPAVNIVADDDGTLAYLRGPIDMDSSPAIRNQLVALLRSPDHRRVRIDLSAVTRFDSSGIATLIDALKIARANQVEVTLQGLHGPLLELFEMTDILPLFNGAANHEPSGTREM